MADYKPLSKVSTLNTFNISIIGSLWNNVTQQDASKISENMYKNDDSVGVRSDLVNSYAWDTAIVYIEKMGNSNYANKKTPLPVDASNTGTTTDEVCNVFDMGSNMYEWITEYCNYSTSPCTTRGGYYQPGDCCAAGRCSSVATVAHADFCFRVVLYII